MLGPHLRSIRSVAAVMVFATAAAKTNPIITRGNMLYDSVTQERFIVRGTAYYPDQTSDDGSTGCTPGSYPSSGVYGYGQDLLTDDHVDLWTPDLAHLEALNINTIRLYEVDGTASHAKFMAAMQERGIYVVVPLTRTYWGYLPADRSSPACYDGDEGTNLVNSAKSIVQQFSQYDNTLFFTAANEIALNSGDAGYTSLPCVKALVRDVHKFQDSCSAMRSVPLIYAGQDIGSQGRRLVSDYLSCADEDNGGEQAAIDVYGLNVYNWCSETEVYQNSGYKGIMDDYQNYGIPMILSEFGCNGGDFVTSCTSDDDPFPDGRTFTQVAELTGAHMDGTFSGGIAYEFSMESNGFGMVLKPGYLDGQDEHILLDSYKALQGQFQTVAAADFGSANWTRHGDSRDEDTLDHFCSWKPHATKSLTRPTCPDYTTLGITGELPPEPPNSDYYSCPSYELSCSVEEDNYCFGGTTGSAQPACSTGGGGGTDDDGSDDAGDATWFTNSRIAIIGASSVGLIVVVTGATIATRKRQERMTALEAGGVDAAGEPAYNPLAGGTLDAEVVA